MTFMTFAARLAAAQTQTIDEAADDEHENDLPAEDEVPEVDPASTIQQVGALLRDPGFAEKLAEFDADESASTSDALAAVLSAFDALEQAFNNPGETED